MTKIKLHNLLNNLLQELQKGNKTNTNKLEKLVKMCLKKAHEITYHTKNKHLQTSYRWYLDRLNRDIDPRFKNINNWARVVLNVLMVTFPPRD